MTNKVQFVVGEPQEFVTVGGTADSEFQKMINSLDRRPAAPTIPIRTSLLPGAIEHQNFLRALEICWGKHYDISVTPDHIWFTILCEVSNKIKENIERYRFLFTDSFEKKEIVLEGYEDAELIDLSRLAKAIQAVTPKDTSIFLPKFSTTDANAQMAHCAAFADAVSPYYNYSMLMCKSPKAHLAGNEADWESFTKNLESIGTLLEVTPWTNRISRIIANVRANSPEPIYSQERCGSGHDENVKGWWSELYMTIPSLAYITNFPTHVAKVDYKNLSTNKSYTLECGIFHSTLKDNILTPEFGYRLYEATK